jgi:hypothetical protein
MGDVQEAIKFMYSGTPTTWWEVNEIKTLFGSGQSWTRTHAQQFAYDAWKYCGFGG